MNVNYVILDASYQDRVMALEKAAMQHPWDSDSVRTLLTENFRLAVGAVSEEDELLSYVGCSYVIDEADIGNLATASDARRRGLGEGTMKFLLSTLKAKGVVVVFLEVAEDNTPAKALYDKLGFNEYGFRKDYYGPGKGAILMKKSL